MPKRKCSFNDRLAAEFPYLEKRPHRGDSDGWVYCKTCDRTFSISNSGRTQIVRHIETALHKKCQKIKDTTEVGTNLVARSFSGVGESIAPVVSPKEDLPPVVDETLSYNIVECSPPKRAAYWNHCFLCCSPCGTQTSERSSSSKGISSSSKYGSWKRSVYLRYLLERDSQRSERSSHKLLLNDVLQLAETEKSCKGGGGGSEESLFQFCEDCDEMVEKVADLHQQLEVVQMRIADIVRLGRSRVVSNSKMHGSNSRAKAAVQNLEEWVIHRREEEERDGGEPVLKERRFLDVLHNFQTWVSENDIIRIPLVYLNRVNTMLTNKSVGSKVMTSTFRCLVKQEDVEDSFMEEYHVDSHSETDSDSIDNAFSDEHSNEDVINQTEEPGSVATVTNQDRREDLKLENVVRANAVSRSNKVKGSNFLAKSNSAKSSLSQLRKQIMSKMKENNKELLQIERKLKPEVARVKAPLICEICRFTTTVTYQLDAHLKEHETSEKNFVCSHCEMGFTTKQTFEIHIKRHWGSWRCDVCDEKIVPINMLQHLESHAVGQVYNCQHCSRPFGNLQAFVVHLKHHSKEPSECPLCPKGDSWNVYPPRTELPKHLYDAHGRTEFLLKCDYADCTLSFFSEDGLWYHKRQHNSPHKCDICDKRFSTSTSLKCHCNTFHTSGSNLICEVCGMKFTNNVSLKIHKRKAHKKKFECRICEGKRFVTRFAYKTHMWVHHKVQIGKVREYGCKSCSKVFPSRVRLRNHEDTHSDTKNYTCEICGFASKTRKVLKVHLAIHDPHRKEKKTLACPYCKNKYDKQRLLNDHVRTHTGETPFPCDDCGMLFHSRPRLSSHRKNCKPDS